MPINRNALLRYKTIDRMLKGGRQATLEELIDACSDALYDYNGYGDVGKRHDSPDKLILNLALDRIEKITDAPKKEKYRTEKAFQPNLYFKNMIGVSRDFDSPV